MISWIMLILLSVLMQDVLAFNIFDFIGNNNEQEQQKRYKQKKLLKQKRKITARKGAGRFIDDGGRTVINSKYANKEFPLSSTLAAKYKYSIRFNKYGYPDFSHYVRQTVTSYRLNGDRIHDNAVANEVMNSRINGWKQPPGFIWHHHQDKKTMQLIPLELHDAIRHSGGASLLQ